VFGWFLFLFLTPPQSSSSSPPPLPLPTQQRMTDFRRRIHNPNIVKTIYGTQIEVFTDPRLMSLYKAKVGDPVPLSMAACVTSSNDVIIGSYAGRLWFSGGESGVRCDVSGASQFINSLDLECEISKKSSTSSPWIKEDDSKESVGDGERKEEESHREEKGETEEEEKSTHDEKGEILPRSSQDVTRVGDPSFENDACRYFEVTLSTLLKYLCFPRYIAPTLTQVAGHLPLEIRRNVLESFQDNSDLSVGISINRAEGMNSRLRSWTSPDDPIEIQALLKSQYYLIQLFRALKQLDFVFDDGRVSPNLFRSRHAFMIQSGYADNAYDLSGPYRNFMSDLASEWWGSGETHGLPLFVPSDTQHFDMSADVSDRFSWIPNRVCRNDAHLQLYRMIGQLIGCMVIGNVQVEIIWPNIVWKWMIGREKVEWKDLGSISTGMVTLLTTLDALTEDQWAAEVGGYLDCLEALPELLKDPAEIERCVTILKRKISSSSGVQSLGLSSSMISLSSSLSKSTGSLLLSLTQMDVPFSLKADIIDIIFDSFRRSCEPQLNAMRDGLHSGVCHAMAFLLGSAYSYERKTLFF
jgi:hypothetical protein